MNKTATEKRLIADVAKDIVGKKIIGIRYLTEEEMKSSYWYKRCPVLILEDGSIIVPLSDDEGNESGVLEINTAKSECKLLPSI